MKKGNFKKDKVSKKELGKALKNILGTSKKFYAPIIISAIFILAGVVISIIAPQYLSKMTNEIANNALKQTINIDIVAKNGFILLK